MSRLPIPGSDTGNWGEILNDFLTVSLSSDGTLNPGAVTDDTSTQRVQVTNSGTPVGARPNINFVAGANTTLSISDDSVNNRVDITISAELDAVIAPEAAGLGLKAQTLPAAISSSNYALNSGVCVFVLTHIPRCDVTTLGAWLTTEGVTASGVCGMAVYSESGTLIDQTVDMTTQMSTAGSRWISANLSGGSQSFAAGNYYIAFLSHFSGSAPRVTGGTAAFTNVPPINGHYPTVYLTGQTTFPASFTPASANLNSGIYFFTVS